MTNDIIRLGHKTDREGNIIPVNLKTSALTTHACIVGASGAGKTGAVIGVIEELIRQNIPVACVDLKGDLANLALQSGELKDKMSIRFLTPGADHGEPVNIFSGIGNPDRVSATVTTLCKLIGAESDPVRSKSHAFLSTIIERRINNGQTVTITDIMTDVAEPPFSHLGHLQLDEVLPKAARGKLIAKLNNLIAAPGFTTWREGIDIDIDQLFNTSTGKSPVVIFSVAHLVDDTERIFAISMFLEEMVSWMRKQPGTQDLKACLLLDEMFGVMPPAPANPATKKPLLTMIKQGRAHGLGVVICSQNPMDLDYKGMSNCQTWLVGRLQTERDRDRVVKGMCSATSQDERLMGASIARLQPRQFLVVRPSGTAVFTTRDCEAKLQGPMSPSEIQELFSSGVAEDLGLKDRLMSKLEAAKAAFAASKSDSDWRKLEQISEELNKHDKS